jgi:hypothetical protein
MRSPPALPTLLPYYLVSKDFYISTTMITEAGKMRNKGVEEGGGGAVATRRSTPKHKERAENDLGLKSKETVLKFGKSK